MDEELLAEERERERLRLQRERDLHNHALDQKKEWHQIMRWVILGGVGLIAVVVLLGAWSFYGASFTPCKEEVVALRVPWLPWHEQVLEYKCGHEYHKMHTETDGSAVQIKCRCEPPTK